MALIGFNLNTARLFSFLIVLIGMMCWEWYAPRRKRNYSRTIRWPNNLALAALNTILLRLIFPVLAIGVASAAQREGWGILHFLPIAYRLKVLIAVVILDWMMYTQHYVFHQIKLLWRFHRMHHTDLDLDTTSGLRFHPIEIILSMLIKMTVVLLLGAPVIAVLIFEILLNALAMFNHANIYIPAKIDRIIRFFIVTPDMHRVHHSIIMKETNSNYGFNLALWDRLFKTYRPQPSKGHPEMIIGLKEFRDLKYLKLNWLLAIPFLNNE